MYEVTKINDHYTFDIRITIGVLNESDLNAFFADLKRLGARVEDTKLISAEVFKNGNRELKYSREMGFDITDLEG